MVVLLMVLGAIFVASWLLWVFTVGGFLPAVILVVLAAVVLWIFSARGNWWIAVPVGCSFGGLFYFGFRIYTHEMALLLAVLALLPFLTVTRPAPIVERALLPQAIYILIGYLSVHLAVSEYLCQQEGPGGTGNILRVYMYGLWPLVFAVLFFRYGSTKSIIKNLLLAMYLASLCRVILGFIAYYLPRVMFYLPGVNYVPSGALTAGLDLRASVLIFTSLSLCYTSLSKLRTVGLLHLLMLAPALWLILLGGGRVSVAMFFGIILLWTLLQRRVLFLGALAVFLILLVVVLNRDPAVIYRFPARMQRTLSIFVIGSGRAEIQKPLTSSNVWHKDLAQLGRQNWLKSPVSFLVGNRVHRFDEALYRPWISSDYRELIVSRQGYYEAGLWTILAVTGCVGAVLYLLMFYNLLGRIAPVLIAGGVRDYTTALCFLAFSSTLMWLVFCWIYGHFPSQELMLMIIAAAATEDDRYREAAGSLNLSQPLHPTTNG